MQLDQIILQIAALALAMAAHEAAHAGMAFRMGDPTAQKMGRLTLNPARHIDPFGTVLLPGILMLSGSPFVFGWAKPVPVDFSRLRSRHDAILVSIAGIVVNLSLAMVFGIILQFVAGPPGFNPASLVQTFLIWSIIINAVLGIFNLLPFPPLDGGRIVTFALPPHLGVKFNRMQPYAIVALVILIATGNLYPILAFFLDPVLAAALGDLARTVQ